MDTIPPQLQPDPDLPARVGPIAPPPPVGIGLYKRHVAPMNPPPIESPTLPTINKSETHDSKNLPNSHSKSGHSNVGGPGHPFDAEMDIAEVDDRLRPGTVWGGRAQLLSRSTLVFTSRRMCYLDRMLVLAVHLIDSEPVPLFGKVVACEYEGEGLYDVEIELVPIPESRSLYNWVSERSRATLKRA